MLKLLVKKQLAETFRSYFYDVKKNKKRSTAGVIALFILFFFLIVGIFGGMFTMLSVTLCKPLSEIGFGWMFYLLMAGISLLLGLFGSVFNTYAGLYLPKDNDLLLSMPIPVKYIIASRLLSVYLLGAMYSGVVILPAVIVGWIVTGFTVQKVIGGIVFTLMITFIVLMLSCLLGWCVAKISQKLKNKSFITVILSLTFIAVYYIVYFRAQSLIAGFLANAAIYGEKIKGAAYWLYKFGEIAEGNMTATVVALLITAALLFLTWIILKSTFLSIATSVGNISKKKSNDRAVGVKSPFAALLSKEFAKFVSSSNYMLNCGLGIIMMPAVGILLLIKGNGIGAALGDTFGKFSGAPAVILCAAIITICSMIDTAAPSISLEGKNMWVLQTLPVKPQMILRAKLSMQLILAAVPTVFTVICGLCVFRLSPAITAIVAVLSLVCLVFSALFSLYSGVLMPNMNWTNEIIPIKQGGAVMLSLFGGWGFAAVFAVVYFIIGYKLGTALYLSAWILIFAVASAVIFRWLETKGAEKISKL